MSSSDTRFFTNEPGNTVLERFNLLTKDCQYFDCLVGYFYASGFLSLSKSLDTTEKIRVLIGLSTDRETYDLIQSAEGGNETSIKSLSSRQAKDRYLSCVRREFEHSDDSYDVEKGVRLFIEWIQSGKLEIRVYKEEKIHAKLYIMSYPEGSRDEGRVITGSSNFSRSGLEKNIEFNVELKDHGDYIFAKKKFEELWQNAEKVSEDFVTTIQKATWLSDQITPYELYLKFLYEYLKEQINRDLNETEFCLPGGYMELQYQKDAVIEAMQKLEEYNGVFISDVVGLGKTYITAMLLKALNSRALILAPPSLVNSKNPSSWPRVLEDFGVGGCHCESTGKLEHLPTETDLGKYGYVVIDEAHKFRNESTQMYDNLYKLCVGKKVILVTATPLNNSPKDILAQIKLFQPAHASTLPNPQTRDLEAYFNQLQRRLQGLDRQKDKERYLQVVRENSERIRQDVLQYLMIRRTRTNIVKYYSEDLKKQGLKFPEVVDPHLRCYQFDEKTDKIFNRSLEKIVKDFHYSRYQPLLYLKQRDIQMEVGQKNMMKFMRILLIKRLESSFYAFSKSLERMISSYETFISMYQMGVVYTSDRSVKKDVLARLLEEDNLSKIDELMEGGEWPLRPAALEDNLSKIDELMEGGRVQKHTSDEFVPEYLDELQHDLSVLRALKKDWNAISSDPKLEEFLKIMRKLRNQKVLIFIEAKETADYLVVNLEKEFGKVVLSINGSLDSSRRQQVIDNFDGNVPKKDRKDDFQILVTPEILAKGMNLPCSNVVINYDEWEANSSDPKLEEFLKIMRKLRDPKVLIFTEAKETADYLAENLEKEFGKVVLSINGSSDSFRRQQVIDNFDGNVSEKDWKDDFQILVTTEVLAEGVNLHRSNVVINYDIPWNPTRMIQRVGRVNRVNTPFPQIHIYNFFPAGPINKEIGLEELVVAKIEAFIEMLGNDAKLLTDEEIKSHDLFRKLTSAKTITGEEEDEDPELKYLAVIRNIRDSDPELFARIQNLPKKARVGRSRDASFLITFFRKGKVRKIYRCNGASSPVELDFGAAVALLEADQDEKGKAVPMEMFECLGRNKEAFDQIFVLEENGRSGTDAKLLKFVDALKAHMAGFTEEEVAYVQDVRNALEAGTISKQTVKTVYDEIKKKKNPHSSDTQDVYRWMYNTLHRTIDYAMILRGKITSTHPTGAKEVILSEYFGA